MMAETGYWQQSTITARQMFREGQFGEIFFTESEYHHTGLEALFVENGKRTWRYGMAPMHYPTHCVVHHVGVTGERLTEVSCLGWGDGDDILKDNVYKNPFWNETAFFKTSRGRPCRVAVWWRGAHAGAERAQWWGSKTSFAFADPNGHGPVTVHPEVGSTTKDSAGFTQAKMIVEPFKQPMYWATDMLPAPLRHESGHQGSHTFITHEFVESCLTGRRPAVDVYEAVAFTLPGIIAHQSALKGGESMKIPDLGSAPKAG
jgi:hypothetical protein